LFLEWLGNWELERKRRKRDKFFANGLWPQQCPWKILQKHPRAYSIASNSHYTIFTAMRGNLIWVGYILGVAMLVMGILILSGFFQLKGTEAGEASLLQTVFGIVLLLYGIYRLVMTEMQRKRNQRERNQR